MENNDIYIDVDVLTESLDVILVYLTLMESSYEDLGCYKYFDDNQNFLDFLTLRTYNLCTKLDAMFGGPILCDDFLHSLKFYPRDYRFDFHPLPLPGVYYIRRCHYHYLHIAVSATNIYFNILVFNPKSVSLMLVLNTVLYIVNIIYVYLIIIFVMIFLSGWLHYIYS